MNLDERFWEIDFVRGIAIILVVLFHFLFMLRYFEIFSFQENVLFWGIFPVTLGSTFLTLVGISLTLSYTRARRKSEKEELHYKYVMRGLKIFSLGLLASLGTWIIVGEEFIVFGILHLIGLSILLSYPLLHYKVSENSILLLSLSIMLSGLYIRSFTVESPFLIWLGVPPSGFVTLDYYPVFPWFAFVLLGIFLGKEHYKNYERRFALPSWLNSMEKTSIKNIICFLGRHTLKIYLAHPLIFLIIFYLLFNPL